ncbi:MAG TPA: FtsX-like permease family protein [Pyrinomonadaceae bacterium]|nr:FtsX-like permease family protein [Pyrinomonadaceae bacterium]
MNALNKKLFRDFLHLRGQIIATALVVACGVASFISMRSTYDSLLVTQQNYYSAYRFADVFAHLKRAPESIRPQIEKIPGVAAVQTRVVSGVTLNLPTITEPAQGKIVSIPENQAPTLNDLHFLRGRYIKADSSEEVIVSGAFADANGFDPGDQIEAVINGRWRKLTIVGVALSPEYIYEIRAGDIFPDNKRFGILWMSRKAVAAAFDMSGAFNDVSLTLAPGASERRVIENLDRILEAYGGTGAYGRADQQSHRFISNEFSQLEVQGTFLPAIFLGVTAFLLHLVLSRLVNTQREQIGLLKAFGYTNFDIGWHFLQFAFAAVSGGVILGILLGMYLGSAMTNLYGEYFHFPVLQYEPGWLVIFLSFFISFGAAALGAISAARKAVALPPAEAMRPEPPAQFRAGFLEEIGLQKFLSPTHRIILRNLSRQPVKAVLSIFGIALAAALLFTGFYFFDAINKIIEIQFNRVIRDDVDVVFYQPRPGRTRYNLANLPGVIDAEVFRAVPARLRFEHRTRRVGLMGAESRSDLRRIVDKDGRVFRLPAEGVVLTKTLADALEIQIGDVLTVEVLEGARPVREIKVVGTIDELMGMNAYMEIHALNRLLNEDDVISGAYLSVDSAMQDKLYSRLKQMPSVAGVGLPGVTLDSFNETFGRTIGTFTFILVSFASVIVLGVVYNGARISLSERGRELASLRVLGFTQREIAVILLGEQAVLTLLAIPFGYLFGFILCVLTNNMVDTEIMRLPLVFSRRTFVVTFIVTVLAAIFSAALVVWRIRNLDLIEVLKTRE